MDILEQVSHKGLILGSLYCCRKYRYLQNTSKSLLYFYCFSLQAQATVLSMKTKWRKSKAKGCKEICQVSYDVLGTI
jgi:hypothetical protein